MATKIIKFHDNHTTYAPITLAKAVQFTYNTDKAMSVQEAIEQVAGSALSISSSVTSNATAISTHVGNKVNLSYNSTNGIYPTGAHGDGTGVKINAGTGIKIKSIEGGIEVSNTQTSNQTQWLNVNGGTTGFNPEVRLDNNGSHGKYKINGSAASTGYADVYVSYATGTGITISAKYTDTNNKVDVSNSDTSKLYVTGAANSGNTTLSYDSNIYLETTAGHIHATQFNGKLNGSITSSTTATTQSTTDDSTKVATTAFVHDVVDSALTAALKYKGVLNSQSDLPTATANTVGHVYVVKTAGDYTVDHDANGTATSNHLETGDYVIGTYIGTSYVWVPVNGENQWTIVSNPELPANGTAQDLLTIEGQTLTLKHGTPTGTTKNATKGTDGSQLVHNSSFVLTGINWKADANGHVTEVSYTRAKLPADTHKLSYNIVGAATGMTNSAQSTNGNVNLRHIEGIDGSFTATSTHKITGASGVSVTSDASGNITITGSKDNNYSQIAINAQATSTTTEAAGGTEVTLAPASSADKLNIESVNKWVQVKGTSGGASADKIQIAHDVLWTSTPSSTAALYKFTYDNAGHITGVTAPSTGTVGINSLSYSVSSVPADDFILFDGTWGTAYNVASLTGDTTFVK